MHEAGTEGGAEGGREGAAREAVAGGVKVQVKDLGPVKRRIDVEIPAERVRRELDRAYRSMGQRARIRGFRPGRVPRSVLERYFADDVRSEVTTRLVREGVAAAIERSGLEIVAPPELEVPPPVEGEALSFSATVEVRPRIEAVERAGIRIVRPSSEVAEEEVDRALEALRHRAAELVPIEDRDDLRSGDFATVDVVVRDGEREVEALGARGAIIEVGGGALPGPVGERLASARVGETFSVEAPAPDGAPEDLTGRPLRWEVAVRSLAARVLPELDDEFAKDHGECETLAELRDRLRDALRRDAERRAEEALRQSLLEALIERNPLDLPESLVARRAAELLEDLKQDLSRQGLRFSSPEHEEEARGELLGRARRDVHARLLLDALAEELGVSVSDDELAERIGRIVASAGAQREKVREAYARPGVSDALRSDMRRMRTLDRLLESIEVGEAASRPVEDRTLP